MGRASTNDINVTPLIDVLLVLIIVFLVLVPMLSRVETVALPPDEPGDPPPAVLIALMLHADLEVSIDEERVPASAVLATLRARVRPEPSSGQPGPGMHAAPGPAIVVFVDAEDVVPWQEFVTLIDSVRSLARDPNHDEIKVAVKFHAEPR